MIVVLDIDGVVLDLSAERPVRLLGARLLSEYRGAGLSYLLRAPEQVKDLETVLLRASLPKTPVLGSDLFSAEQAVLGGCSSPGVHVSRDSLAGPPSWGTVKFNRVWSYSTFIQNIWCAQPPKPEVAT